MVLFQGGVFGRVGMLAWLWLGPAAGPVLLALLQGRQLLLQGRQV